MSYRIVAVWNMKSEKTLGSTILQQRQPVCLLLLFNTCSENTKLQFSLYQHSYFNIVSNVLEHSSPQSVLASP